MPNVQACTGWEMDLSLETVGSFSRGGTGSDHDGNVNKEHTIDPPVLPYMLGLPPELQIRPSKTSASSATEDFRHSDQATLP